MASGHTLYKTNPYSFKPFRSVVHTQAKMFSPAPETTFVHYARSTLSVAGHLVGILLVPLMLKEKYEHTCTYLVPVVALLTWGIFSIASYRQYAPSHVKARWDAVVWAAAVAVYALLHATAPSRGFCVLFTVFGAPAIAFTAGYAAVGRFYNERLDDEARHPYMRERNAAEDAKRAANIKKIALHGFEVLLLVATTFATFYLLNESLRALANNNANPKHLARCVMPILLCCQFLRYTREEMNAIEVAEAAEATEAAKPKTE